MAFGISIGNARFRRWPIWLSGALCVLCVAPAVYPLGMVARLDQPGRTTEFLRLAKPEIGLSLAFTEIPLLNSPARGPKQATEINYYTGYVQIRTYYADRHINNPLAVEILEFNNRRNEGKVIDSWRKNIRLSLGKAQFQKHGSGLQWEIIKVPKSVRAILGEGGVGLQVNGYRKIMFSGTSRWQGGVQRTGNYRQSKFPSLDMKQNSRFTIKGNIGSKIFVSVDQDSKRESDLSNRIQIRYKGEEDDILQSVELGNTTLNLPNTRFMGYSQRIQGLFGVKATAKIGNLDLTVITSQEKGNTEKTRFTAGVDRRPSEFRDYQYLKRTFFDIGMFGRKSDPGFWGFDIARDTIIDFKLFRSGIGTSLEDKFADIYVDPGNHSLDSTETIGHYVREMENVSGRDYFWEPTQFWIRLEKQHTPNDLLACWMVVSRGGVRDTIGSLTSDTLQLKLLMSPNMSENRATWDYEWKNVYFLGARELDYEEFELDIYKGLPGDEKDESNLNHQGGVQYLQLFGLDQFNEAGHPSPDGRVDRADYLLDLYRGHLVFPNKKPFAPDPDVGYSRDNPEARLEDRVEEIYTTTNATTLREKSKYFFRVVTSKRTSRYYLRHINILEGSETVTFNQQRLIRGVDYEIDYELGQITFLTDRVLNDPTADLTVDFEYAPFISASKKSLFGGRAEYAPSQKFKIGSSFLYKGTKSTDRQPKLGQEKSRSMMGELDFSLAANPAWMTNLADAIPFVETSAGSNLRLSGEIARSMPNPNTEGKVYLDDFESTKLSSQLGRRREYWTKCSVPEGKDRSARCPLIWYNPFNDFYVSDIYDREVRRGQEGRLKVLVLRPTPADTAVADPAESWCGVMRALSSSMFDQTKAEFLEVRLGTHGDVAGRLHIDLGEISEDIDGDGTLDSEDREVRGADGTIERTKNGLLDDGEDTGLDSLFSPQEPGYDGVANPDPSGDDWHYDQNNPDNYEHINGTENNREGDLQGTRPDTEDLDGDEFLDIRNTYESFTIDLLDSEYKVEGSERAATRLSPDLIFRTYRIPLKLDSIDVRFARLWLDGITEQKQIIIATLEIVENRWVAQPLFSRDMEGEVVEDTTKKIRAEVINTEENENYNPPPSVLGYYDPHKNVREKEQSLLLKFENFAVGDTGWVIKTPRDAEDYTGYRFLEMYVHGDLNIPRDTGIVSYIFRMGSDINNFYQFNVDLEPGWDEHNYVFFDFNELTPLKKEGTRALTAGDVIETWSPDSTYRIRGNPSLTKIRYIAMGITYKEGAVDTLSGEVWADELRLEGVRRDQGMAARISVTADFADLWGFTINSDYRSYSFRGLVGGGSRSGQGINLLNGSTVTKHNINTRFSLHKFLPASWRAQLPITVKYSKDVSVPKLLTGSDVVLTPGLQEDQTTTKISYGVTISEKLSLPSKHWLAALTVNAFSVSGAVSRSRSWSPPYPTRGDIERYSAKAQYNLNFKNLLPISPLIWTRHLFFPERVWATKLQLLPRSFRARGQLSRSRNNSINSLGRSTDSYTRDFKGQADWSFEPFSVLKANYAFNTQRDLYDKELINFSLNPRKFRLGREIQYSQRLGASYSPPFFGFLSPSTSYNVDYKERVDKVDGTRSASVSSRITAGASVNLKNLLREKGGKAKKRQTGTRDRPATPQMVTPADSLGEEEPAKEQKDQPKEKDESGGFSFRPHAPIFWVLRLLTSPLEPIRGSYSHTQTRGVYGLQARPSLKYRIGLISTLGVAKIDRRTGTNRDSETAADKFSLNSAIRLFGLLKVSTSFDYSETTTMSTTSTRRTAMTFPKMSTSLSKLSKLNPLKWAKPLNWMLEKTSAKFDYTHSVNSTYRPRDLASNASDDWDPQPESEDKSDKLGASTRFSQTFKNGLRITADYGWSMTRSVNDKSKIGNYSDSRQFTKNIGFSANYSFRAPNGVRFPFLRKLRFKSSMNVNLAVKQSSSRSEGKQSRDGRYTPKGHKSSLQIEPNANYSFSSAMKGGFKMSWRDSKDEITGRTSHTRLVSIWLEFRF